MERVIKNNALALVLIIGMYPLASQAGKKRKSPTEQHAFDMLSVLAEAAANEPAAAEPADQEQKAQEQPAQNAAPEAPAPHVPPLYLRGWEHIANQELHYPDQPTSKRLRFIMNLRRGVEALRNQAGN